MELYRWGLRYLYLHSLRTQQQGLRSIAMDLLAACAASASSVQACLLPLPYRMYILWGTSIFFFRLFFGGNFFLKKKGDVLFTRSLRILSRIFQKVFHVDTTHEASISKFYNYSIKKKNSGLFPTPPLRKSTGLLISIANQ
jgi:hypothetical protein